MILLKDYGFVRALLDRLPVGVVVTDVETRKVLYMNGEVRRRFGVVEERMLNEPIGLFLRAGRFRVDGKVQEVSVRSFVRGRHKVWFLLPKGGGAV